MAKATQHGEHDTAQKKGRPRRSVVQQNARINGRTNRFGLLSCICRQSLKPTQLYQGPEHTSAMDMPRCVHRLVRQETRQNAPDIGVTGEGRPIGQVGTQWGRESSARSPLIPSEIAGAQRTLDKSADLLFVE